MTMQDIMQMVRGRSAQAQTQAQPAQVPVDPTVQGMHQPPPVSGMLPNGRAFPGQAQPPGLGMAPPMTGQLPNGGGAFPGGAAGPQSPLPPVPMQAPDGTTQMVPAQLAPFFQARGHRVIGQ